MRIYDSLDADYDPSDGCVLAVGNFDGVHRGHQLVFATAVRRAREKGLRAVLFTFSAHPAAVVSPEGAPAPLMDVRDRLKIAAEFGFDAAFVLNFDPPMASLAPGRFVEEVLEVRLGVRTVVAGESWRFGQGRKGDMSLLASLGPEHGFGVHAVEPFLVDDLPVSSTRIRGALAAGDVSEAARLLGRPHFVRGTVVSGAGRGRKLGFPTVNLDCHGILVPAEGVYAGAYQTAGAPDGEGRTDRMEAGPAAVSIGSAPTFGDGTFAVEAHLVDCKRDLYGETVTTVFLERLREQRVFGSEAELAEQIARDVEKTRSIYGGGKVVETLPWT